MKLPNLDVTSCTYLGSAIVPCGCATLPGKSYCTEHYAVVYQVGTARARRRKDERVAAAVWNVQDAMNEALKELEEEGYNLGDERWDVPEEELE